MDGAGAAYLFQKDQRGEWSKVKKLTAHDAAVNGHFGKSIAMCGATVLVGAPGQGAVYLFQDDGTGNWRQVAKLTSGAAKGTFYFGNAVAISGTTVAVGSPAENNGAGAIYLFQDHGSGSWRQFAKLTHPPSKSDTASIACFGASLALSGNTLLAGARNHDGHAPKSGAAYLYRLDKIQ